MASCEEERWSDALSDYIGAFPSASRQIVQEGCGCKGKCIPFLTHYGVGEEEKEEERERRGGIRVRKYCRGMVWRAALSASSFLSSFGLVSGSCVVHYMTGNRAEDIVLRLASVIFGYSPVTVNWQADTDERALFKTKQTESKLVFVDKETPLSFLSLLKQEMGEKVRVLIPCLIDESPFISFSSPSPFSSLSSLSSLSSPSLSPPSINDTIERERDRMIIFTSGTTGNPKGARLSYNSYQCNQATFESFLLSECNTTPNPNPKKHLTTIITNPLHHANSTSMTDWSLRRGGTHLHLLSRYTTLYWAILIAVAADVDLEKVLSSSSSSSSSSSVEEIRSLLNKRVDEKATRIVCPLVSRHIDFLSSLSSSNKLPVKEEFLKESSSLFVLLLGSAPVGPTTVRRLVRIMGTLPTVRFGSTETCLQVIGTPKECNKIPKHLTEEEQKRTREEFGEVKERDRKRIRCFERGWGHFWEGEKSPGYFIGCSHFPFTDVCVVRGVDPKDPSKYFKETKEGEPGEIICRGKNLMTSYVGMDDVSNFIHFGAGGWYTNLGDVAFWLWNELQPDRKDIYWMARTSALLIKGGANYSYEQINSEIMVYIENKYKIMREKDFGSAVVGINLKSEHEDDCCLLIELLTEEGQRKKEEIENTFLKESPSSLSKGAKVDHLQFGKIPRNFKGAVLNQDLKKMFKDSLSL